VESQCRTCTDKSNLGGEQLSRVRLADVDDRSSFSRERSDGDWGFWRFNAHNPGDVFEQLKEARRHEERAKGICWHDLAH
jgi:hypothetical protein